MSCCIYLCVLSVCFFAAENKFLLLVKELALGLQKLFIVSNSEAAMKIEVAAIVDCCNVFILESCIFLYRPTRFLASAVVLLLSCSEPAQFCKGAVPLLFKGLVFVFCFPFFFLFG